jgi:hypothetical protein
MLDAGKWENEEDWGDGQELKQAQALLSVFLRRGRGVTLTSRQRGAAVPECLSVCVLVCVCV